jgi:tetratricopeptide (TPR) repeat protein
VQLHLRGEPAVASRLFHRAYQLDPAPEYLYSAARAEHEAGQYPDAVRDYDALLQRIDQHHALRDKADFHAAAARSKAAERQDRIAATNQAAGVAVADGAARRSWAAGLVGMGAASGVAAAWLASLAYTDQAWLDGLRYPSTRWFDPARIAPATAADVQRSVNRKVVAAWTLGGVAAAGIGVGSWLLWTSPRRQTVLVPAADGVQVAWTW